MSYGVYRRRADYYRQRHVIPPLGAPGSYTLTVDAGSYSITGSAVGLYYGRQLVTDAGSYVITGADVSLLQAWQLGADAGSYSLVGADVSLLKGWQLSSDVGSYALNGAAVTLSIGYGLVADAGSYSLSGSAVSLLADRELGANAGSYALTGSTVELTRTTAEKQSFEYKFSAVPRPGRGPYSSGGYRASDISAYTVAGQYELSASAGSYTITGSDVTLSKTWQLGADAGSYLLTGSAVNLDYGFRLDVDAGSYALTGSDVSLLDNRQLAADVGSYGLTGSNVTLTYTPIVVSVPGGGGGGGGGGVAYTIGANRRNRSKKLFDDIEKSLREVVQGESVGVANVQTEQEIEKAVTQLNRIAVDYKGFKRRLKKIEDEVTQYQARRTRMLEDDDEDFMMMVH